MISTTISGSERNSALVVDDADDPVRALLHLEHNALKYSAGHVYFLLIFALKRGFFLVSTYEN